MSDKFSENDIRPEEFEEEKNKTIISDLGKLLSKRLEFVTVNCPACNSDNYKKELEKNSIEYCRCKNCDTLFVNPRPTAEILDWFYRISDVYTFWNKYIFPASEKVRRQKIFVPRVNKVLEFCEKFNIPQNSLIEIGAGFGTFCDELKSRNVFNKIIAIEPTPELAATCRSKGLETIESTIENVHFDEKDKFDVAVSFEVIEHLFNPAEFIAHMVRLIQPGGMLMLTCPNGQGFDIETLGPLSTTVDHEHLNYFNPGSLAGLLKRHGMELIESVTPGKLDTELVRNKVLEGAFSLEDQPFLKKVLIDEWEHHGAAFQDFLVARGMSSNLWVVARKATTLSAPSATSSLQQN